MVRGATQALVAAAEGVKLDAERLAQRVLARAATRRRTIVAIAGPPASGKTSLTAALSAVLADGGGQPAPIVQMDGFHLDNQVLDARGWRGRKGAPHTFDVAGLVWLLERIRSHRDGAAPIYAPRFDRARDIACAAAVEIPAAAPIVLVEGNYLLLDDAPWSALRAAFDVAILLRAPEALLRARLEARWRAHNVAPDEATRRIEENDLPNARLVADRSAGADVALRFGA